MNIFQHLKQHGNCNNFEPKRKASDGPAPVEYWIEETSERLNGHGGFVTRRVKQLADRLERGENLFHDDERPRITGLVYGRKSLACHAVFGVVVNGTIRAGRVGGE